MECANVEEIRPDACSNNRHAAPARRELRREQRTNLFGAANLRHLVFPAICRHSLLITEARQPVDQSLRQIAFKVTTMHVRLLMAEYIGAKQMQVRIPTHLRSRVVTLEALREGQK